MVIGPGHENDDAGTNERHKVGVVGVNAPSAVAQLVTRFVALIEPRPVAKSNPRAASHAGNPVRLPVLKSMASSTPNAPGVKELQLKLPPTQGTELLPFVMS